MGYTHIPQFVKPKQDADDTACQSLYGDKVDLDMFRQERCQSPMGEIMRELLFSEKGDNDAVGS